MQSCDVSSVGLCHSRCNVFALSDGSLPIVEHRQLSSFLSAVFVARLPVCGEASFQACVLDTATLLLLCSAVNMSAQLHEPDCHGLWMNLLLRF